VLHDRLVGATPVIEIADAGFPTTASTSPTGMVTPMVTRSRITLRASRRQGASVASVSFQVAKGVLSRLHAGDRLWLARNACGGLGVSIVRDSELIVAAGAVTSVPLGRVDARIPTDLIEDATAAFRRRDMEFEFRELPVQISVIGQCCILSSGQRQVGPYQVRVAHGFCGGIPGTAECVAIWRTDTGPEVDTIATSWFLDAREVRPGWGLSAPIEMTEW
jgi:hypothetical protein